MLNLPGCIVALPTLTPQDKTRRTRFGPSNKASISLPRRLSEKALEIENLLNEDKWCKIISKIENQRLTNFKEILNVTDGNHGCLW
jgi:pyruvate kinase